MFLDLDESVEEPPEDLLQALSATGRWLERSGMVENLISEHDITELAGLPPAERPQRSLRFAR